MAYKIKKYFNEEGERVMNIWDTESKSWIFDYFKEPLYKICKSNIELPGKEIYMITAEKGSKPYMFDIISKTTFGLSIYVNVNKCVYSNNDQYGISVYSSDNDNLYAVFKDGTYIELPECKDNVDFASCYGKYAVIHYNTEHLQDNYFGRLYGHKIGYYKIFDKKSGKQLFNDYSISYILYNDIFSDIICFCDDSNTYFINNSNQIIDTYEGYVIDTLRTNLIKPKHILLLKNTDYQDERNNIYNAGHKLITDEKGNLIREFYGKHTANLESGKIIDMFYIDNNNIIVPISKTYGKNFAHDWFTYKTDDNFIRIENYDCKDNSLLKFNDITHLKIYIDKGGNIFYVCVRNKCIYIYDESWNCLSDKWVIYFKYYKERYLQNTGTEAFDEIERAVHFNYQDGTFFFYNAHVKENDGTVNTGHDWILKSYTYDKDNNKIYEKIF